MSRAEVMQIGESGGARHVEPRTNCRHEHLFEMPLALRPGKNSSQFVVLVTEVSGYEIDTAESSKPSKPKLQELLNFVL